MPPIPELKKYIDDTFKPDMADQAFIDAFDKIVRDILTRARTQLSAASDTAAYLGYYIVANMMRAPNIGSFSLYMTNIMHDMVNDQLLLGLARAITGVERQALLRMLGTLFYNLPAVMVANVAGNYTYPMAHQLLAQAVGAVVGPPPGVIRSDMNNLGPTARVARYGDEHYLEVGSPQPMLPHPDEDLNLATWNLQGTGAAEDKWNAHVANRLFKEHPELDVLAVQEVSDVPLSATHVRTHQVSDQFGNPYTVDQYIWTPATGKVYYIFFMRIRGKNLALVVSQNTTNPLRLVDDGAPILITSGDGNQTRGALGVRLQRFSPTLGHTTPVTVFTFHAISPGGPNAAAITTEIDHYVASPWTLLGDFNRDPYTDHPTDQHVWIPEIIAVEVPPAANTHPAPGPATARYDYLVHSAVLILAVATVVYHDYASDHFASLFKANFP